MIHIQKGKHKKISAIKFYRNAKNDSSYETSICVLVSKKERALYMCIMFAFYYANNNYSMTSNDYFSTVMLDSQ